MRGGRWLLVDRLLSRLVEGCLQDLEHGRDGCVVSLAGVHGEDGSRGWEVGEGAGHDAGVRDGECELWHERDREAGGHDRAPGPEVL